MVRSLALSLFLLVGCGARTGAFFDEIDGDVDADPPPTPPTVACEPTEAWTTIGRASVVQGTAEDDGWITSWRWEVSERPSGSVVLPLPRSAEATSLTPDSEGDYLLTLTVTDDEGESESCDALIHSVVGPPIAFCPDDIVGASVDRAYSLEGDGFDDELIVSFEWAVTSRPEGSHAQPEPSSSPVTTFTPDLAGSFELTLTVTDNDGATGSCTVEVVSSGPPLAICPPDATVPTRQPHELRGDAEDDGEIVAWAWEVIDSPPSSVAGLDPPRARSTTLIPDRVGPYVLRLTVTDDTGLVDSCETIVTATPTPPDAICPSTVRTTPLTEVTLRGQAEDDGSIVGWDWDLVGGPAGTAAAPPSPPDTQSTTFVPDVAGEYTLRLTVIDDDGMEGSCEATILAIPGEGLRVELYWNPPDRSCDTHESPCDPTDVDLHLLHPEADRWFSELDCHFGNCIGRVLEWDSAGLEDNPRQDLDDVEGFGPENINMDEPVVGARYTVGVHFYASDASREPAQAYVSVYCGTIEVDPVYEVGPVALVARDFTDNDFWRVATVAWDGFGCTITPLVGDHGGPDIILTGEAQEHR